MSICVCLSRHTVFVCLCGHHGCSYTTNAAGTTAAGSTAAGEQAARLSLTLNGILSASTAITAAAAIQQSVATAVGVPLSSVSVNLVGGSIIADVTLPSAAAASLQQQFLQGKVSSLGGYPIVSIVPEASTPVQGASAATARSGASISIRLTGDDLSTIATAPLHSAIAKAAGLPASKVTFSSFPDKQLEAQIELPSNESSLVAGILNDLMGAMPKAKS